jgi:peptide/nickel transport system substrate-binding protein
MGFVRSRRLAHTAVALLGSVLFASGVAAEPRTDVNVVAPWHVSGIEPSQDGYIYQRMQVAEALVGARPDGTLRPLLATEWSSSEDGLTWRFKLREGVRFHDGTVLTPDVAVANLVRSKSRTGILGAVPLKEFRADGDSVVVELTERFSSLPATLANYATAILAPASFNANGDAVQFLGTGPFKVEKVQRPISLSVTRFADYWGPQPALQSATYMSAHRGEARSLMAQSGDADLVFTLDPASFTRLSKVEKLKTSVIPIPRIITVKMNLAIPALADKDARRALSLATDRAAIAQGVMRFPQAAATQMFPGILSEWHDAALPPLSHDVEEAKRLLAGLGWTPGSDGVLQRDGTRFSLTMRTFPNRPELPIIASALQDQWRQIGVEVKVSIGNSSDIPAGHRDNSLELGLAARNYAQSPDPLVNVVDDYKSGGGDWGAMNWNAPDVAEALKVAVGTSDPEARAGAIRTVTQAIHDDLPVLAIAYYQHTVVHSAKLQGLVLDPLEISYGIADLSWAD